MYVLFAWFTASRISNNDNNGLTIICPYNVALNYRVYKYSSDYMAGIDATEDDDALALHVYDSIILDNNTHMDNFIRMDINFINTTTSSDTLILNLAITGDYNVYKNDLKYASIISNIIQFKFALYSYTEDDGTIHTINNTISETNDSTIFSTCETYFSSLNSASKFVTVNNSSSSTGVTRASDSINVTLSSNTYFASGFTGLSSCVFYIQYGYDEDLVDYWTTYGDSTLSVSDIGSSGVKEFINDLEKIEINMESDS